jgi:hypothetical protein
MTTMQNDGILPLQLLEPAVSLDVTPFAARAIRATGLGTTHDLADFVFNKREEALAMGQAHVEEIRQKILQTIGPPPFAKTMHLDIPSLIRLFLQPLDPQDRSFFLLRTNLDTLVPIIISLLKEPQMALTRNKDERFSKIITLLNSKGSELRKTLIHTVYEGLLRPYIASQGNIIHTEELLAHIYLLSSTPSFINLRQAMMVLGLVTQESFLFESTLFKASNGLYALTEDSCTIASSLLELANSLPPRKNPKSPQKASDLASLISRHLPLQKSRIADLLFWAYRK